MVLDLPSRSPQTHAPRRFPPSLRQACPNNLLSERSHSVNQYADPDDIRYGTARIPALCRFPSDTIWLKSRNYIYMEISGTAATLKTCLTWLGFRNAKTMHDASSFLFFLSSWWTGPTWWFGVASSLRWWCVENYILTVSGLPELRGCGIHDWLHCKLLC